MSVLIFTPADINNGNKAILEFNTNNTLLRAIFLREFNVTGVLKCKGSMQNIFPACFEMQFNFVYFVIQSTFMQIVSICQNNRRGKTRNY